MDEIRIKEKEENKWTVDLVYHSGFCIPLEVGLNKDIGFFVSEAPWLPEAWETVDDLGQNHKQSDDTGDDTFFCQQIDKWNDMYHHRRFENSSNNPYAETVMFYGKRMTGKEVVKMNLDFLRNNPDFRQDCYNIKVIKLSDSRVRCNFDKRVTINGQTKEYPSYLYFTKEFGNNWLIDEESDEITDRNLRK